MSAANKYLAFGLMVFLASTLSACAGHDEIMAQLAKEREGAISTLRWLPILAWLLCLVAAALWIGSFSVVSDGVKKAKALEEEIAQADAKRRRLGDEREDAEGAAFDSNRMRQDVSGLHQSLQLPSDGQPNS